MNSLSFKEAIYSDYTDMDGLICTVKNPQKWSSGNSLLYTGIFVTLLFLRKELEQLDCDRFYTAVSACEAAPGLYNRNPNRPDFESHDDYIGIAAGAFFTKTRFARDILSYGQDHRYHYDNVNPNDPSLSSWHGRFPGRKAFYYMAAERNPYFWYNFGFNSAIRGAIDLQKENSSDKILAWLQIEVARAQNLFPVLCGLWDEHIKYTYGHISNLFEVYFPKDHPFITYSGNII